MVKPLEFDREIKVDRIFLDLENPRHEPYQTESEVIDYLCKHESILPLARDIVSVGLNPLEMFAVVPASPNPKAKNATFIIAEGNRRICAVKLLNDPERAPASLRKEFEKLATEWTELKVVPSVIFATKAEAKPWLERIHNGLQGGIGRKEWSPEQKTRFSGDKKNFLAQTILDYAEQHGHLSKEDRKGKLTTLSRYISNPLVREAIGIEHSGVDEVSRNRPKPEFDALVKQISADLGSGEISSRKNKTDIDKYARKLTQTPKVSSKRITAEPIAPKTNIKSASKAKPKKIQKPTRIPYEQQIADELERIGSLKLQKLYYSICEVELEDHTPLIAVGVWAFIESLSARAGKTDGTDFGSFFSHDKLQKYGFTNKENRKTITAALSQISRYGNTTKHHEISCQLYGEQLHNDMEVIAPLILKCIGGIPTSTSRKGKANGK